MTITEHRPAFTADDLRATFLGMNQSTITLREMWAVVAPRSTSQEYIHAVDALRRENRGRGFDVTVKSFNGTRNLARVVSVVPDGHSAEVEWHSGGPGKSAYSDYRWQCACGSRYDHDRTLAINPRHHAHLAAVAATGRYGDQACSALLELRAAGTGTRTSTDEETYSA